MMTITSRAGRKLAKTRVEFLKGAKSAMSEGEFYRVRGEYESAAAAVADELVDQGFHEADGED